MIQLYIFKNHLLDVVQSVLVWCIGFKKYLAEVSILTRNPTLSSWQLSIQQSASPQKLPE
jgi:hypothetical protein